MDYCINCGAELTDEMETCPECGAERFGRRPADIPAETGKITSASDKVKSDSFAPKAVSTGLGAQADPFAVPPAEQSHTAQQVNLNDMPPIGVSAPAAPEESTFSMEELTAFNPKEAVNLKNFSDTDTGYDESEIEIDPRLAVLGTGGFIGSFILFSIPLIGWLACLICALGGCKNRNRRNLARSIILLFLIVVVIVVVLSFVAVEFFEPTVSTFAEAIMNLWQNFLDLIKSA